MGSPIEELTRWVAGERVLLMRCHTLFLHVEMGKGRLTRCDTLFLFRRTINPNPGPSNIFATYLFCPFMTPLVLPFHDVPSTSNPGPNNIFATTCFAPSRRTINLPPLNC